ncbi:hypothetical protein B0T19DRAFT_455608 [Cercophora scortea]|uniref:Uncharacterized protein n=1 Tax=Cercophora scortea TaxID=314031 RepID=A0AAE0MM61_9PEZI|nr:hypothetical protein B0T19DRAFT_455608 [Cercophora scortea]
MACGMLPGSLMEFLGLFRAKRGHGDHAAHASRRWPVERLRPSIECPNSNYTHSAQYGRQHYEEVQAPRSEFLFAEGARCQFVLGAMAVLYPSVPALWRRARQSLLPRRRKSRPAFGLDEGAVGVSWSWDDVLYKRKSPFAVNTEKRWQPMGLLDRRPTCTDGKHGFPRTVKYLHLISESYVPKWMELSKSLFSPLNVEALPLRGRWEVVSTARESFLGPLRGGIHKFLLWAQLENDFETVKNCGMAPDS